MSRQKRSDLQPSKYYIYYIIWAVVAALVVSWVLSAIRNKNDDRVKVFICAYCVDESLGDEVRVTVLASGVNAAGSEQALPTFGGDNRAAATAASRPAPAAAPSRPAQSSSDNAFDIPEFLKRSRL